MTKNKLGLPPKRVLSGANGCRDTGGCKGEPSALFEPRACLSRFRERSLLNHRQCSSCHYLFVYNYCYLLVSRYRHTYTRWWLHVHGLTWTKRGVRARVYSIAEGTLRFCCGCTEIAELEFYSLHGTDNPPLSRPSHRFFPRTSDRYLSSADLYFHFMD